MGRQRKRLAVYLAHRGNLVAYADGIVRDRMSAEDVVQEAYLRFVGRTEAQVDEPVNYLYRIVRNLALDARRRLVREGRVLERDADGAGDLAVDDAPTPEAVTAARADLKRLIEAMEALPERNRTALEMHRFGGYKLREIGEHLGISTSAAHELVADSIAFCRKRVRGG